MTPHDELEIKARVDDPALVAAALRRAGAELEFRGIMRDRRFDRGGALAARDEVLRLRVYQPADGAPGWGVLGWKGPVSARGAYRHRPETETRVDDADAALAILERLGYDVILAIDRRIESWRLGGAVCRLEWYPAMDVLLEVEGEPQAIERAVAASGLPRERFFPESLPYFVAQYEARTGARAALAGDVPA
jgi:adenylate cyclase class IV